MLVEAIIALSALTIGLLGILSLLFNSLGLNRVISDNYIATYLAAEGVEVVKNIIDGNVIQGRPWNDGFSDGTYEVEYSSVSLQPNQSRQLRFNSVTDRYDYSGPQETTFRRRIAIQLVGSEEIKVNSIVDWTTRGGGTFSVNLENHFFNWWP